MELAAQLQSTSPKNSPKNYTGSFSAGSTLTYKTTDQMLAQKNLDAKHLAHKQADISTLGCGIIAATHSERRK